MCGCSKAPAVVNGKVTADSKDVTGGAIVLSPIAADGDVFPGKPGMADIGPDGTYSLRLEPERGGLAQRFAVRFTPPSPQLTAATAKNAVIPYQGLIPKQAEVEIKPGTNVINIELIPAPKN